MTTDQIFDHFAKRHMIMYNPEGFRKKYRTLHKAIIDSIELALGTPRIYEIIDELELSYLLRQKLKIFQALESGKEVSAEWVEAHNKIIRAYHETKT